METLLFVSLFLFWWFIVSLIIGTFGAHRKIRFGGAFFASLFFSPIIAMLLVLASDKK